MLTAEIQLACFKQTPAGLITHRLSQNHSYAYESSLTAAANLSARTTHKAALIYSHRIAFHSVIC